VTERRALLLLLVPALVYGVVVYRGYDGDDYLRGDCPYYLYTATSLLQDQDLDLSNQIPGGLSFHFDQVSLDRRGRVVPKHPIAMAVASLPFVGPLGRAGTLVFNVTVLLGLLGALYALTRHAAAPLAAAFAVALTGTLSFLPHYAWNVSPDLFATLAVVGGFLALAADQPLRWRDAAGGLLLGIACAAKPAFACLVPAALLLVVPRWRTRLWPALGGLAAPLAAMAALNLHLFGAPHVTAYDRIARLGRHGVETYTQRDDFRQSIVKGLKRQLRHPTQGLLATSAVTLVSWLGFAALVRRHRRLAVAIALGSAALILLFASYQLWDSSHYGNRHLMPAVALAAVPLGALLDAAFGFFRRRTVA
jgi:hypothetical protein